MMLAFVLPVWLIPNAPSPALCPVTELAHAPASHVQITLACCISASASAILHCLPATPHPSIKFCAGCTLLGKRPAPGASRQQAFPQVISHASGLSAFVDLLGRIACHAPSCRLHTCFGAPPLSPAGSGALFPSAVCVEYVRPARVAAATAAGTTCCQLHVACLRRRPHGRNGGGACSGGATLPQQKHQLGGRRSGCGGQGRVLQRFAGLQTQRRRGGH